MPNQNPKTLLLLHITFVYIFFCWIPLFIAGFFLFRPSMVGYIGSFTRLIHYAKIFPPFKIWWMEQYQNGSTKPPHLFLYWWRVTYISKQANTVGNKIRKYCLQIIKIPLQNQSTHSQDVVTIQSAIYLHLGLDHSLIWCQISVNMVNMFQQSFKYQYYVNPRLYLDRDLPSIKY